MSSIIEAKPRTEQFFYSDFFALALVIYGYTYIKKFYAKAEAEGMATATTNKKFRAVVREYLAYESKINIFDSNHTLKPLIIEKMDETLAINKVQTEATFFNFCAHEGLNNSAGYASLYNIGLNYLHMAMHVCNGKNIDEDCERVQEKYFPDKLYDSVKDLGLSDCFESVSGEGGTDGDIKNIKDTNITNCLLFLIHQMKDIYLAVCEEQQAWVDRKMAMKKKKVAVPNYGSVPMSRKQRRALERSKPQIKSRIR